MAEARPTVPRVFLGEAIKQLRDESGISLESAAAHIGKDRQRLIRLVEGKATLTADELDSLIVFLGAPEKRRQEILALGVDARKPPKAEPYIDLGPDSYRRVAHLEAMAHTITWYEKGIFPALIQSSEYVEAQMRASQGIWWNEFDDQERISRAAFRLERQRIVFGREPRKQVELFFTSDAFESVVGDKEVMRSQLQHLKDVIGRYENLTVRVVPTTAVDNPAQHGGLTLYSFGDLLRPIGVLPVVYGPATYFDKLPDTERIRQALSRIREIAVTSEETLQLIEQQLKGI